MAVVLLNQSERRTGGDGKAGQCVSCKINLMQLVETPRMTGCFEVSEKYFCSVPLRLHSS